MKKLLVFTLPIFIPIVIVVFVNEYSRARIRKSNYYYQNITTINPVGFSQNQCSWSCHHNSLLCKKMHISGKNEDFGAIETIYTNLINFLNSFGNYTLANIIFLVVLWPFIMYFLLIKILLFQLKIKVLQNGRFF